jgi:hypothetical protein
MNRADDEAQILRFASSELGPAEESAFLARCEREPGLWRAAALAVVEHRRVAAALGELCAESTPAGPRPSRHGPRAILAAALAAGLLLGALGDRWLGPRRAPSGPAPLIGAPIPPQRVDPPGATWTDLVRLVSSEPAIPASEEAALRTQGVEVEEQPIVYYIDAGDGAGWAVPTQEFTLRYTGK